MRNEMSQYQQQTPFLVHFSVLFVFCFLIFIILLLVSFLSSFFCLFNLGLSSVTKVRRSSCILLSIVQHEHKEMHKRIRSKPENKKSSEKLFWCTRRRKKNLEGNLEMNSSQALQEGGIFTALFYNQHECKPKMRKYAFAVDCCCTQTLCSYEWNFI